MGTKRPHPDLTSVHATRKANLQTPSHHAHKRAARNADPLPSTRPSTHLLRKKIRDTTRLLAHASHLPADVRIESERALAGYKQDLTAVEEGKRRAKMIGRYHMVRFFGGCFPPLVACFALLCFASLPGYWYFCKRGEGADVWLEPVDRTERQKATRHLKKLRRRLADTMADEERREVEARVHVAEVDLNYAVYCPLDEKYTSLYPQKRDGEDEEAVVARHMAEKSWLPLWKVVERCMEDGTLEALRNGTGDVGGVGEGGDEVGAFAGMGDEVKARRSEGIPIRSKKSRREERVEGREQRDEGDGSDGGFFEE